jgi:hypothetical protein
VRKLAQEIKSYQYDRIGGWGGIRTPGELSPSVAFKATALNHSATHPMSRHRSHVAAGMYFARRKCTSAGAGWHAKRAREAGYGGQGGPAQDQR